MFPYPHEYIRCIELTLCYNVQTAVDAKHKLIAAFEVTSDGNDKNHLTTMALAAEENMGAEGVRVVADTGYDSVQDIVTGLDIHVAGTAYDICVPAEEGGVGRDRGPAVGPSPYR
ncbi:MAG: transposase [Treponema sp.]|nr:transposase [Treponema sp.]